MHVWINVTTSASWNRPAVGIIRVEQALAKHLRAQLGKDICRLCIWKEGQFRAWDPLSELRLGAPLADNDLPYPLPGDLLISVGLDWDQSYSREFYSLSKKHGLRIITCCYDLIPVLFPQYCVAEVARHFIEYFVAANWASEAVLCISEQTRRDYSLVCSDLCIPARKTVVIPLGDNLPSVGADIDARVDAIARSPFVLFVSTIEPRKNHEVLYRAYHLLARRGLSSELPTLVFVGMPGWGVGDLMRNIETDPLTVGKIILLNHVSDGELEFLYRKALFCLFPSLYEGWGLPVAEALAMGKAVIASREGSLREIGGDLVRYAPAWDAYSWADAIYDYVRNPHIVKAVENRVKSTYVPRKWSDTAAVVASLVNEMVAADNPVSRTFDLLPGYDMSTQCGVHWGADIRTTGVAGVLLYGPYIPMRPGHFRLKILGAVLPGHTGRINIEVTSDYAKVMHLANELEIAVPQEGVLVDCHFELTEIAENVEFRCQVESGCKLHLHAVSVSAI